MWYYGLDPTMLIVLPGILLAMIASFRVQHTFSKYAAVGSRSGWTASAMAQDMLNRAGIEDVRVERVAGRLTDHFDPKARVLRLSQDVYDSGSIAALGVAAHEVGHAIQHAHGYAPLSIRNAIVPMANFGSSLGMLIIMVGIGLALKSLAILGCALFTMVVLFQVINLPVEFNASRRAREALLANGIVTQVEDKEVGRVLNAAAPRPLPEWRRKRRRFIIRRAADSQRSEYHFSLCPDKQGAKSFRSWLDTEAYSVIHRLIIRTTARMSRMCMY